MGTIDNKEKILFFHPQNNYTGSTRVLANIIEQRYIDMPVTIICQDDGGGGFLSKKNINLIPIRTLKFKNRKIKIITYLSYIIYGSYLALKHRKKYSIFYVNTLVPIYASIIGRLCRKEIVYHVHEKYVNPSFIGKIEEFIFNHTATHRIYVSQYTRDKYISRRSCTEEIRYNFLPKSYTDNIRPQPIEVRPRNRILMISSLSSGKGVDTFVEIAKILNKYYFTLVLSADKVSIKKYFSKDLPDNLIILPAQADIRNIIKATDLILNLSNPEMCIETFGMTILEAMPYAVPAIVPNIGGPVELVKDGYNGKLVDTSNIKEIITSIRSILEEKVDYNRFCENTIKMYKNKFKI